MKIIDFISALKRENISILKSYKEKNSLFKRIIRYLFPVIAVSLILITFITFLIIKKNSTSAFIKSTGYILNQNKNYMDLINASIENASTVLSVDEDFNEIVSKNKISEIQKIEYRNRLSKILTRVTFNNIFYLRTVIPGIVKDVRFYSQSGFSTGTDMPSLSESKVKDVFYSKWGRLTIKGDGKVIWTDPLIDPFSKRSNASVRSDYIISSMRLVKSRSSGERLGILAVNIYPGAINEKFTGNDIAHNADMMIVNNNNIIVSHKDISKIGEQVPLVFSRNINGSEGYFTYKSTEGSNFVYYIISKKNNWKYIAVVPEKELYASAINTGLIITVIMLIFMIIAFFFMMFLSFRISEPLKDITRISKEISNGNYDIETESYGILELDILSTNFNEMRIKIKDILNQLDNKIELVNADLKNAHDELRNKHKLLIEKQTFMERELVFAQNIQQKMLPEVPKNLMVDMDQKMYVATSVGGDFYCLKYDSDKLSVAIGDVSGHGVPSALVMVLMRDAFLHICDHIKKPARVLKEMNEKALEDTGFGMFTTFFYAEINLENMTMDYANAGHNEPILFQDGDYTLLDTKGMILGVNENDTYGQKFTTLKEGDVLFLYTDGISELCKKNEKCTNDNMLGIEPIIDLIKKNNYLPAKEINNLIDEKIYAFAGAPPYEDDVTFVCIKF